MFWFANVHNALRNTDDKMYTYSQLSRHFRSERIIEYSQAEEGLIRLETTQIIWFL
jgi:hypothetical protein